MACESLFIRKNSFILMFLIMLLNYEYIVVCTRSQSLALLLSFYYTNANECVHVCMQGMTELPDYKKIQFREMQAIPMEQYLPDAAPDVRL